MIRKFRFAFIVLPGFLLCFACVKKMSNSEVQDNLKARFEQYLNLQQGRDTSLVKFKVLDVTFFEDKQEYLCEFHVNMKEKTAQINMDTVGLMKANISKDFLEVKRRN